MCRTSSASAENWTGGAPTQSLAKPAFSCCSPKSERPFYSQRYCRSCRAHEPVLLLLLYADGRLSTYSPCRILPFARRRDKVRSDRINSEFRTVLIPPLSHRRMVYTSFFGCVGDVGLLRPSKIHLTSSEGLEVALSSTGESPLSTTSGKSNACENGTRRSRLHCLAGAVRGRDVDFEIEPHRSVRAGGASQGAVERRSARQSGPDRKKRPLKGKDAGAIIRTVSRIIFSRNSGLREESPGQPWEMQR